MCAAKHRKEKPSVQEHKGLSELFTDPLFMALLGAALVLWPWAMDPSIPKGLLAPTLIILCGLTVLLKPSSLMTSRRRVYHVLPMIILTGWFFWRIWQLNPFWKSPGLGLDMMKRFLARDSAQLMLFTVPLLAGLGLERIRRALLAISWILTPLWLLQLFNPQILSIEVNGMRITSTLGNPNILALFAAMSLILSVDNLRNHRGSATVPRIILDVLLLFFTRSMSALLGLTGGLIVYFLVNRVSLFPRRLIPLIPLILVMGGNYLLLAQSDALDKGSSLMHGVLGRIGKSVNVRERRMIAWAAWQGTAGKLMYGSGPGIMATLIQSRLPWPYFTLRPGEAPRIPHHAHSEYLELLAEEGLPGLVFLVGLFLSVLKISLENDSRVQERESLSTPPLKIPWLSVLSLIFIAQGFSVSGRNPFVRSLFFLIMGAVWAESARSRNLPVSADDMSLSPDSRSRTEVVLGLCFILIGSSGLALGIRETESSAAHFKARSILANKRFSPGKAGAGNELKKAESLLKQCDPLARGGLLALKDLGGLELAMGRMNEAVSILGLLESTAPGFGDTRSLLGAALITSGKRKEAAESFMAHFRAHPLDADAAVNVSAALQGLDRSGALNYAAQAWRLSRSDADLNLFQDLLNRSGLMVSPDQYCESGEYLNFVQSLANPREDRFKSR